MYDQLVGKPLTITGPNAANDTTSFQYDALGRTILATDRFGIQTSTTFAFDSSASVPASSVGTPVSIQSQTGAVAIDGASKYSVKVATQYKPAVTTFYDRLARPIRVKREGFKVANTDTVYNTLGQVSATSVPYASGNGAYWTVNHYDDLGRIDKVWAPTGATTATTYNGLATVAKVTGDMDAGAQTTTTLADAHGRTVSVWNADNVPDTTAANWQTSTPASIVFKLDGFGRMRETDLKGQTQVITATYDSFGKQTSLNDPDKGSWSYINSALGQVLQQTDARGTVTKTTYDILGRPINRTATETAGPVETANWYYYDTTADATSHRVALGNNGWIGALQQEIVSTSGTAIGYATANSSNSTNHYYDSAGRPQIDLNFIDGTWFYAYTSYDPQNRVKQVQDYWRPSGANAADKSSLLLGSLAPFTWRTFGYQYTYDNNSYVLSIADTNAASRTWWSADGAAGYDEQDRVVKANRGGMTMTRTYRPSDGAVTGITTTGSAVTVSNFAYTYDQLGNLKSRTDSLHNPTESLTYDVLNRLTVTKQGTTTYLANGNIQNKPNVSGTLSSSNFTYDATHPHAVATAFGYSMGYDANGNINSRSGNGETWYFKYAGFDKPRWMAKTASGTSYGSEFLYNANHSRILHLEYDQLNSSTGEPTHYVRKRIYGLGASLESDFKNVGSSAVDWENVTTRIYVPAPDGVVGAEELSLDKTANGGLSESANIYHYDHLGSIVAITKLIDPSGNPALTATANKTGIYSEDAWGARRNPNTWVGTPPATTDDGHSTSLTPRGFTGHEMLDDLGFIHMNGRIYDPLTGRFLSADAYIQFPGNLQSYNRYSYVQNSPLTFKDPDGHLLSALVDVAFMAYDTYQHAVGKETDAEYGVNMAANAGFFALDVVTEGGGIAARAIERVGVSAAAKVVTEQAVKEAAKHSLEQTAVHAATKAAATIAAGRGNGERTDESAVKSGSDKGEVDAKSSSKKADQAAKNRSDGAARQEAAKAELEKQHPDASVQGERTLRTADGKKALDPLTGEGRRIDNVVVQDGKAIRSVETTSQTADKAAQIAKENRIRESGGTFIRDKNTKKLIDLKDVKTEIDRR